MGLHESDSRRGDTAAADGEDMWSCVPHPPPHPLATPPHLIDQKKKYSQPRKLLTWQKGQGRFLFVGRAHANPPLAKRQKITTPARRSHADWVLGACPLPCTA